jgi:hypothetical protein
MSGTRSARQRFWTGALLLAVQLAGAAAIALGHTAWDGHDLDHIEAPGSHAGGHNDAACHVCRHAEARFLPGSGSAVLARLGEAALVSPALRTGVLLCDRFEAASAPRAPPHA